MDFFAHPVTKSLIYQLVTLHATFACKRIADNHCFEVVAVTIHGQVVGRHTLRDVVLNAFWSNH